MFKLRHAKHLSFSLLMSQTVSPLQTQGGEGWWGASLAEAGSVGTREKRDESLSQPHKNISAAARNLHQSGHKMS